jgi:hypothetical protein
MTFYTKNGCYPRHLPEILEMPNGEIRTDSSTFTDEELALTGWTEAPSHPTDFDPEVQIMDWNTETSNYEVIDIPQSELDAREAFGWLGLRGERNEILSQSDYMVIKAYETGTTLDSEWATYRQALRDLPSSTSDLNAVVWPTKPS